VEPECLGPADEPAYAGGMPSYLKVVAASAQADRVFVAHRGPDLSGGTAAIPRGRRRLR
jgi:hypothetical protein